MSDKTLSPATTIAAALAEASRVLREGGVAEPRREAATLLAHALGCDRTFIITHPEHLIDEVRLDNFAEFVQRRVLGEPVQYIVGYQEFFGLKFLVTPAVLIPRPETELLVQEALSLTEKMKSLYICDVGTGSGCISVALTKLQPAAHVLAIDISLAAIKVAVRNAKVHNVNDRINFLISNGFDSLKVQPHFDLILSNPPYVAAAAFSGLQREVRGYEPRIALTAGVDGLAIIRRLLNESSRYLKSRGFLLLEIGFDQCEAVEGLARSKGWKIVNFQPDLQGIPRIAVLQAGSQHG